VGDSDGAHPDLFPNQRIVILSKAKDLRLHLHLLFCLSFPAGNLLGQTFISALP